MTFDGAHARRWNPSGDRERVVEILGLDQVIPAELLARLREGTVGQEPFLVAYPNARRRRGRVQLGSGHVVAARPDLLRELPVFLVHLLPLGLAHPGPHLLLVVNQQHVFHRAPPWVNRAAGGRIDTARQNIYHRTCPRILPTRSNRSTAPTGGGSSRR